MVNSPARRNLKKPVHAAAQSMMRSGLAGVEHQTGFRHLRMSGVMRRLGFGGGLTLAEDCLIPTSTWFINCISVEWQTSPYQCAM